MLFQKKGPVEATALCSQLKLPPDLANKILEHLVEKGLLVKTFRPYTGFVPGF